MSTVIITRKAGQYTVVCDDHDKIIAVVVYVGMHTEYREPIVDLPLFGKYSLFGENIKYLRHAIKSKIPIDISRRICYTNNVERR